MKTSCQAIFLGLLVVVCMPKTAVWSDDLPTGAQDAATYLLDFATSDTKHPKKSNFETNDQYVARLPHWPSDQSVWIKIMYSRQGTTANTPTFRYDPDGKTITFYAAGGPTYQGDAHAHSGLHGVETTLASSTTARDYDAVNGFGAEFSIHETDSIDSNIYILNVDQIKTVFDKGTAEFNVKIGMEPDAAQALVKNCAMFVKIQPIDYSRSYSGFAHASDEPTFNYPWQEIDSENSLECNVAEFRVLDMNTNKAVYEFQVPTDTFASK